MAHTECDHPEPDRALGMSDGDHYGAEACRPRDVRLDATAEVRTVAALCFTGQ